MVYGLQQQLNYLLWKCDVLWVSNQNYIIFIIIFFNQENAFEVKSAVCILVQG